MTGRTVDHTLSGVECPAVDAASDSLCGSTSTRSIRAGFDINGHRIRMRECDSCGCHFTTVEVAIPFVFNRVDTVRQERARVRSKARNTKRRYHPRIYHDSLTVVARLLKGQDSNMCKRGYHLMVGYNVIHKPNGHRYCRSCKQAAGRAYRAKYGDYMRAYKREQYRAAKKLAMQTEEAA